MSRAGPIRILIVDDHPVVREGLKAMLGVQPDMSVVGDAATARQALALFSRLRPDVALLDLRLPDMGGVELITALLEQQPGARLLVISSYERVGDIRACLDAGAAGYVVKDVVDVELLAAIRSVASGSAYVSGTAAARLFAGSDREKLTSRELDVLRLMAEGRSNQEIAKTLKLSPATIKGYVHTILGKLGVRDRTAAVVWASRHGLS